MDRFESALSDFVRISWTSDLAMSVWAPRIQRCIAAWADIEVLTSDSVPRQCALVTLPPDAVLETMRVWQSNGLSVRDMEENSAFANQPLASKSMESPSRPCRFAVGNDLAVSQLYDAWHEQDAGKIGRLLGYPDCCIKQYVNLCVHQHYFDPTWPMAVETVPTSQDQSIVEIKAPVSANILWRSVGIRGVPHLPCRFDCSATSLVSNYFLEAALRLGFADEMRWLQQILSWPVEWSSLHGVAEIKTPILKISTKTDPSHRKVAVRWVGSDYPEEGGRGISFPYQTPQRTRFTESLGFQRGLVNLDK